LGIHVEGIYQFKQKRIRKNWATKDGNNSGDHTYFLGHAPGGNSFLIFYYDKKIQFFFNFGPMKAGNNGMRERQNVGTME
jgi:hypothetical protein